MNYRFTKNDENYEDYSSGRVLHNQRGTTSFPVRLASEIFQMCSYYLRQLDSNGPYAVYDPCCGGAFLLTTVALRHGNEISKIYASDADENVLTLAQKNLSLITIPGMRARMDQIKEMLSLYNKTSHEAALKSAERLESLIVKRNREINVSCFKADITNKDDLQVISRKIDIIMTDLPYGNIVSWNGGYSGNEAAELMLSNIQPLLSDKAIIAIVSDKGSKITHDNYTRLEKIKVGKRKLLILKPNIH